MKMETGRMMDGRRSDLGKNRKGGAAGVGDTDNGKRLGRGDHSADLLNGISMFVQDCH